jgi:carbamoylphosphate synthase large subunit
MKTGFIQSDAQGSIRPRILLTDTNRWPVGPRIAMAFASMGCDVDVVCSSPGHPAAKSSAVRKTFPYTGSQPLVSLKRAIESMNPDMILPLCDRSVLHLHQLHTAAVSHDGRESKIVKLIERSLGAPQSYQIVSSRFRLLQTARSEGIRVPEMIAIESASELDFWCAQTAPPWVIKADGTWGGRGVRVARSATEARKDWFELCQRPSRFELLKRLSLNRDRGWILSDWKHTRPHILVQAHIKGRPANCAVACWRGRLLAGIAVEVVEAQGPTEPAIVVRVVEGTEMLRAAELLAQRLDLSGFFGLDFMIEEGLELPYLIEMNPRCTPPCPIPLGRGRDLVAALRAQLTNGPLVERKAVTSKNRITYFPQYWGGAVDTRDGDRSDTTFYDVPEGEPELVQELLHPWSARSLLGRTLDAVRKLTTRRAPSKSYIFEGALEPANSERPAVLRR